MDLLSAAISLGTNIGLVKPSTGVSVVLMAFNEEETLETTAREIVNELAKVETESELIIVNDGSSDKTGEIADRLAAEIPIARVVHHPNNLGLGGVYRTGFAEAKQGAVTFFPADGQFPASIISQFLPLMADSDMVLGYLPKRKESVLKKTLSYCERAFYNLLFGGFPRFQGIMMFHHEMLDKIELVSSGRGWAVVMELILRARAAGYRIRSEPTAMRPRQAGQSKVSNLRTIWSNLVQMLQLRAAMGGSRATILPIFVVVLLLFVHGSTLMRYPSVFVDEGWFGSRAWALKTTGRAFGPLDRGVFDRFDGHWTYFPMLPAALQAVVLAPYSQGELLPLRLLSLFSGLALLISLFYLTRKISGTTAAWVAILLVGLSRPFVYSAHLARYDIFAATLGFTAMAIAYRSSASAKAALLAGLAVGAAFESHPAGMLYGPVVLLLYLIEKPISTRRLIAFVGGCAIGIVIYLLLHVVRYPETWTTINRIAGSVTHKPPLATLDLVVIFQSIKDTIRLAFYGSPFLLPFVALAFIYKRPLLILFGALFLCFAFVMQHKLFYYAILISPIIEITAAHLIVEMKRRWQRVLVGSAAAMAFVYAAMPLAYDWNEGYRTAQNELREEIRPEETIMGTQTWWFGLQKNPWYSWEELLYYQRYRPDASLEQAFLAFRPDILLIDGHLSTFLTRNYKPGSYADQLNLPAEGIQAIIQKYGRLRTIIDAGYHGKIHVIAFRWP